MSVPTYDQFIEPILRYLADRPNGATAQEVHEAAALELRLSEEDRRELIPSGTQRVYKNRAGWAHDRLKRAGYSRSVRRGFWQLTREGFVFAQENPEPLSDDEIARIATEDPGSRLRVRLEGAESVDPPVRTGVSESLRAVSASPEERLEAALREIRQGVADELLQSILDSPPEFFERLVLDLLHAMGYGASREDLQTIGGSGDGGVDGVISLDRLGLEKVHVQAKRWQGSVGRPEIQGFYGALAGQRSRKGVFITTSTFSKQALDFAGSVEGIVLVDGDLLTRLMMNHGIGVSTRSLSIPKFDSDYFEDN